MELEGRKVAHEEWAEVVVGGRGGMERVRGSLENSSQKEMEGTRVMHMLKAICATVSVAVQAFYESHTWISDLLMERKKRQPLL